MQRSDYHEKRDLFLFSGFCLPEKLYTRDKKQREAKIWSCTIVGICILGERQEVVHKERDRCPSRGINNGPGVSPKSAKLCSRSGRLM